MTKPTFKDILEKCAEVAETYSPSFTKEPRAYAPISAMEGEVVMTALRASEKNNLSDKISGYENLINHTAFVLERLHEDRKKQQNMRVR